MRIRVVASDMDSGLEKADRSISSVKGRRWAKPLRADSVILLRNARKACGGSGGWEAAAVVVVVVVFGWGFVIGRTGGD